MRHEAAEKTLWDEDTPKADPMMIVIHSAIHGKRVWTKVGVRQHVCRDGRAVRLAVWSTPCLVCGEAFEVATPRQVISDAGSRAFTKITCERHRLTPAEASRLAHGARFDETKRSKLACEAAHTAASVADAGARVRFAERAD